MTDHSLAKLQETAVGLTRSARKEINAKDDQTQRFEGGPSVFVFFALRLKAC